MGLIFGKEISNCLPKDPLLYGLTDYIDSNFAEDLKD